MKPECVGCKYNINHKCSIESCAAKESPDIIRTPSHYTSGEIETIDIIKDSVENFESYLHGNIIKYVSRYRLKGGIEDLKKSRQYINRLINHLENNNKGWDI